MRRRLLRALTIGAGCGALIVLLAGIATASGQAVCTGLDSGKIDTSGDPHEVTVTAPAGHLIDGYCVKAGSDRSVPEGAVVYVDVDPPVAELTISHPSGKAVSHYAVSYVEVVDPEPTPTDPEPSPTPTDPEPSPTATDPEPSPTSSSPDPEPSESGGSVSDPKPSPADPGKPDKVRKPETLPRTGADWQVVALASALLAAGGALTYLTRRTR